jgi:hypothetical protein
LTANASILTLTSPEAGVRQRNRCERDTGPHHQVERVDGERLDPDPHLAGCRLGHRLLDDVQDIRLAELVEHDDS